METLLRVMAIKIKGGGYLPNKFSQTVLVYLRMWYVFVIVYIFLYIYVLKSLRHGNTYVALKPHLEILTQEILFPYLCLSDEDKQLWNDDPTEYLRKEFGMVTIEDVRIRD